MTSRSKPGNETTCATAVLIGAAQPLVQNQSGNDRPEHSASLIGRLRVGKNLLESIGFEHLRQENFAGHRALGRQDTADSRQRNQPADASECQAGTDTANAHDRPIELADPHQFDRRDPVAQRAANRKGKEARERFSGKGEPRPSDVLCDLEHDQRHDEQQDLVSQSREKERDQKGQEARAQP